MPRLKPVVALDIDGTLGDYHGHFIKFAQEWTGRRMPWPQDINPGQPLHKHLGMSKATYRQCKLAYRQGGLKRSMPAYRGARELTVALRKAGAEVYICTTRPYLRLDNIDPDTRHWLRRNGIQFDGVLFGEHKYRDLVKIVGKERVCAVLDDLPELCAQATSIGLPAIIRDQPYNRHVDEYPRADDLYKAFDKIWQLLIGWRNNEDQFLAQGTERDARGTEARHRRPSPGAGGHRPTPQNHLGDSA